jgi:hypothetical protein
MSRRSIRKRRHGETLTYVSFATPTKFIGAAAVVGRIMRMPEDVMRVAFEPEVQSVVATVRPWFPEYEWLAANTGRLIGVDELRKNIGARSIREWEDEGET